jgi:hypothetical protein
MNTSATAVPPPSSLDSAIDPSWLTKLLRAKGILEEKCAIVSADREKMGEGLGIGADLFRLNLVDSERKEHFLISKQPTSSELRPLAEASGIYDRELAFYTELAETCPLESPTLYFAGRIDHSDDFLLLLEDLTVDETQVPCDQIEGLELATIAELVTPLANFRRWSRDLSTEQRMAFPTLSEILIPMFPLVQLGWEIYRGIESPEVGSQIDVFASGFANFAETALAELADDSSLIHGDLRADNLFRRSNGTFVVIDYQMVSRANPVVDLAYLMTQSSRKQLVEDDHKRLVVALCGPSSREWDTYRMASGLYLFIPALAMMTLETANERGRDMALTLMRRWVHSFEVLRIDSLF